MPGQRHSQPTPTLKQTNKQNKNKDKTKTLSIGPAENLSEELALSVKTRFVQQVDEK